MQIRALSTALLCLSFLALSPQALASSNNLIVLPNGQNCALPATIDKSIRSLCRIMRQKADQATTAAADLAKVAPAAGDTSPASKKHRRHNK